MVLLKSMLLALFSAVTTAAIHNPPYVHSGKSSVQDSIIMFPMQAGNLNRFRSSARLSSNIGRLSSRNGQTSTTVISFPFISVRRRCLDIRGGSSMWSSTSATSRAAVKPKRGSEKQSTRISFPTVEDISSPDTSQHDTANTQQETKDLIDAFLTRDSRNSFIARVYAILTGQLLVTALSVIGFSGKRDLAMWFLTRGKLCE